MEDVEFVRRRLVWTRCGVAAELGTSRAAGGVTDGSGAEREELAVGDSLLRRVCRRRGWRVCMTVDAGDCEPCVADPLGTLQRPDQRYWRDGCAPHASSLRLFVVDSQSLRMSSNRIFHRAMSLAVHELRTPITVASGYLRMLLREQAGPLTDAAQMFEEADRSCARIGALISEMSELGKLEARAGDGPVTFDFAALAAELAKDMHEGEDRGLGFRSAAPHPSMWRAIGRGSRPRSGR